MSSDHTGKENTENALTKRNGCGDVIGDIVEDIWQVMTPEMVERLKCVLTEDLGLSKKDADKFIQCQRDIRRQRICLKKDKRAIRIGPRNQWIKELSRDIGDQMAMLIVDILLSNRTSQTKKITEKVLDHLCKLTGENTTVESAQTRVERTMVVVADRIGTWIGDTISKIELEMKDKFEKYASLETLSRKSLVTITSLETESITESDEIPFDDISDIMISESEVESLIKSITSEEKESSKSDEEVEEEEKETSDEDSEVDEEYEELGEEQDTTEDDEESEVIDEEEGLEEVEDEELPEEEDSGEEEETQEEGESGDEIEKESVKSEVGSEKTIESKNDSITDSEIIVETPSVQSRVTSKTESTKVPLDILELLKTDIDRVSKPGETSKRQRVMKDIIDKRFENIAKEKLDKSLDSLEMLDIDKAASVVANWVEQILSSADILPKLSPAPSVTKGQGSAYEVKQGEGSKYEICKLSSTTVAEKITVIRGLDPPLRKKKIPKSFSPMNLKSTKDWADWVLGTAKVGEEWGKWLDTTLVDIEQQLSKYKSSESHFERYQTWRDFRDKREQEAQKWRVEKQKIKYEGELWNRKLNIDKKPEKESSVLTY